MVAFIELEEETVSLKENSKMFSSPSRLLREKQTAPTARTGKWGGTCGRREFYSCRVDLEASDFNCNTFVLLPSGGGGGGGFRGPVEARSMSPRAALLKWRRRRGGPSSPHVELELYDFEFELSRSVFPSGGYIISVMLLPSYRSSVSDNSLLRT
ncbi:hypothetical protein Tco_0720075 [Tanacetum coccineum]